MNARNLWLALAAFVAVTPLSAQDNAASGDASAGASVAPSPLAWKFRTGQVLQYQKRVTSWVKAAPGEVWAEEHAPDPAPATPEVAVPETSRRAAEGQDTTPQAEAERRQGRGGRQDGGGRGDRMRQMMRGGMGDLPFGGGFQSGEERIETTVFEYHVLFASEQGGAVIAATPLYQVIEVLDPDGDRSVTDSREAQKQRDEWKARIDRLRAEKVSPERHPLPWDSVEEAQGRFEREEAWLAGTTPAPAHEGATDQGEPAPDDPAVEVPQRRQRRARAIERLYEMEANPEFAGFDGQSGGGNADSPLIGRTYHLKIDARGRVLEVKGVDVVGERMISAFNEMMTQMPQGRGLPGMGGPPPPPAPDGAQGGGFEQIIGTLIRPLVGSGIKGIFSDRARVQIERPAFEFVPSAAEFEQGAWSRVFVEKLFFLSGVYVADRYQSLSIDGERAVLVVDRSLDRNRRPGAPPLGENALLNMIPMMPRFEAQPSQGLGRIRFNVREGRLEESVICDSLRIKVTMPGGGQSGAVVRTRKTEVRLLESGERPVPTPSVPEALPAPQSPPGDGDEGF